ncbi:hypothetical protein ABPG74_008938 [Tetrahymena malaccensis]
MDNLNSSFKVEIKGTDLKQTFSKVPSRSQSQIYISQLSDLSNSDITFSEELPQEEGNEIFDKSFNSHEINTETQDNEDQLYYYPKVIDVNRNNLVLKRHFSKIDYKGSSTEFQSFLLLAKYFFSVGILALPYVYNLTGLVLGSVLLIFCSVFTVYSIHLVIAIHKDMILKNEQQRVYVKLNASITDIAHKVYGVPGQMFCRVFGLINNLGGCISYVIFFEMYIIQIIQTYLIKNLSYEQAHLIAALVAFAILFPFSTVNHLSLFWQTNLIGFFFGLIAIGIMFYTDLNFIQEVGTLSRQTNDLWRTDHFFLSLGIVVYSLQIIPVALNVRDCMEKPHKFLPVFQFSTAFTCTIYLMFGIVCHLAMGEYVDGIVLINFAPNTLKGMLARLLYTISVLLSYPLKFYVVIQLYENLKLFKDKIFCQEKYDKSEYKTLFNAQMAIAKRYLCRYGLILFIFIISLLTVKLAKIISLLGSFAILILQFIIPQLCYMKYFNVSLSRQIYGYSICFVFFIASMLGVYRSIESLFLSEI